MPYRLVSFAGDQTFELLPGRSLVVGRGVTSDIAIYDPTISRRHAELIVGADGVQVKDLGSSNGTCINGSRVSSGRLKPNDSITFGKVLFQLKDLTTGPNRSGGGSAPAREPVPRGHHRSPAHGERRWTARHHQPGPALRLRAAPGRRGVGRGAAGKEALAPAGHRPEAFRRVRPRQAAPQRGGHDVRGDERGPGVHRASQRDHRRAGALDVEEPAGRHPGAAGTPIDRGKGGAGAGGGGVGQHRRPTAGSRASRSSCRAYAAPCARP